MLCLEDGRGADGWPFTPGRLGTVLERHFLRQQDLNRLDDSDCRGKAAKTFQQGAGELLALGTRTCPFRARMSSSATIEVFRLTNTLAGAQRDDGSPAASRASNK